MIRIILCCFCLAGLLTACSKHGEPKPASPPPATAPAILPPQLIITNEPVVAVPSKPAPDISKIERGIQVKDAGDLYFTFPRSWHDKLTRVSEGGRLFDSIQFHPRTGDDFALMVNVNNVGQTNADKLDLDAILKKTGQAELTNSVETSLNIHDLQGPQIKGCYFVITDKNRTIAAPKPGQYLFLTQGYAKIGRLILSFRLVSNQLSPEQEQMLEMIKTTRFVKK